MPTKDVIEAYPAAAPGAKLIPRYPNPLYKFFARILRCEICCPNCGSYQMLSNHNKFIYNPDNGRFRCRKCHHFYFLGVLAWKPAPNVVSYPVVPQDWIMPRTAGFGFEAASNSRVTPTKKKHPKDPSNVIFGEEDK